MKKLIGSKEYYKMVLVIAVPIMVQNGITNFVNMLDNIMVGQIGTEEMSSVSIVNQIIFVYNLCIFGGFSGAGIFTTQFSGTCNTQGIRETCRFKLLLGIVLTILAFAVCIVFGENIISSFLNEGSEGNLEATLDYSLTYLKIAIWGLPPFMIVQVFGTTLSECGETVIPMKAGIAAFIVNLIFNWLLIFGNLGFPSLGVAGAAIATVMSRIAECLIIVIWTCIHTDKFQFAKDLLADFSVNKNLAGKIVRFGTPLLINEAVWSVSMTMLIQCYSVRGLDAVAGFNISGTLQNLFQVVFQAIGRTVGIIVGMDLGLGDSRKASDDAAKLIAFSVFSCFFLGLIMLCCSGLFPQLYNTNSNARIIACHSIIVISCFMPLNAFKNAGYFTIRSGGKTWITFMTDGGFIFFIEVPLAFLLSRFTTLAAENIFFCVNAAEIIKAAIILYFLRSKIWVNTITS